MLLVRRNIRRAMYVSASVAKKAGSDCFGGGACPMGTEAPTFEAVLAIGSMVVWTPAGVLTADTDSDVSASGP